MVGEQFQNYNKPSDPIRLLWPKSHLKLRENLALISPRIRPRTRSMGNFARMNIGFVWCQGPIFQRWSGKGLWLGGAFDREVLDYFKDEVVESVFAPRNEY